MMCRCIAMLLTLIALVAASHVAMGQSVKRGTPPVERPIAQLIVKYKNETARSFSALNGASKLAAAAKRNPQRLIYKRQMSGLAHVVELAQPLDRAEAVAVAERLKMDPNVEYAEIDEWVYPSLTPNDQFLYAQWHYMSPLTAAGGANLHAAWDVSRGQGIIVAVLDTGIVNHPDLAPNVMTSSGYDFITGTVNPNRANDGDGRDADASDPGDWRSAGECSAPSNGARNSSWHGTHVAGTIAAVTNNLEGVSGVAYEARILPVRVLGRCGGTNSDLLDAIRWAAGVNSSGIPNNPNRAQVINLSLGSRSSCSTLTQEAIDDALAAGSVVVVATGNEGEETLSSPAVCTGVIAVTAHTYQGDNAAYANVGPGTTISAPGGGACATANGNGFVCSTPDSVTGGNNYSVWSTDVFGPTTPTSSDTLGRSGPTYLANVGTSMAAPHVSGVAALLLSHQPWLPPAEVSSLISNSARTHPADLFCSTHQVPDICGSGLLDARAALDRMLDRVPMATASANPTVITLGQQTVLTANATPRNGGSSSFTYSWTQTSGPPVVLSNASTATPSFLGTNPGGTHVFTVTAVDANGYSAAQSVNVRSNNAPAFVTPPGASVAPGGNLVFNVAATDPEGDSVTYVATNLPTGSSFIAGTGQFTWNGVPTTLGTHTFEVIASDSSLSSAQTTVTITIAHPPPPPPASPARDSGGGGGGSIRWVEVLALLCLWSWAFRVRRVRS